MSGRIRSIKPEWLEDELMSQAPDGARVMSIALILLADDYGNGRVNKLQQAARVFPPSDESLEALADSYRRFSEAIEILQRLRFIGLYQVAGQHYFTIRKWSDHQKVSHPGKPLVPGPPEDLWGPSGDPRETLARPSGDPPEHFENASDTLRRPSCLIGSDLIGLDLNRSVLKSHPKDLTGSARDASPAAGTDRAEPVENDLPSQSNALPPESSDHPEPAPTPAPTPKQARPRAFSRPDPMRRAMESRPELVEQLFEAYRSESGLTGATLDGQRQALFLRLAYEGVTVEQVRSAVRGAKFDPWARDEKKLQASVVLGSAEQRDKFIALERDPPVTKGPKPPQPNDESNRYVPRRVIS